MGNFTTSDWIAFAQTVLSFGGVVGALYLFYRSLEEKRQMFRMSLYDRIYGNPSILTLFYEIDKKPVIESLERKIVSDEYILVELEKETDATLKYLDFIGYLYGRGDIKKTDLEPFSYELSLFFNHPSISKYRDYLKTRHQLAFPGLELLGQVFK